MFWQEDSKKQHFTLPDTIQDAVFNIHSKVLPIDHSFLLSQALLNHLPWLEEVNAGVHSIGVHDGNGWKQDHKNGLYYPSRRSKLVIRMPKENLIEANKLVGKTLDLGKYKIDIVKALKPKLLSSMQVVFAKAVACDQNTDEDDFLQTSYNQLKDLGIQPKKMLAGLESSIKTDTVSLHARSLMVADLTKQESVKLQEHGIGKHRLLGCGLFIPHKDIESADES